MDINQIRDLSQIVAGIVVVISLIYLAIQVRQGIKVNSANAHHHIS